MILFPGFDLSNIATLITTAFYQPPKNANHDHMTRIGRFGHLMILYYLPLVIYVPTGLICAWYANESKWVHFKTYEDTAHLVMQIWATSFCFAPFLYTLLSLIYYGVSVFSHYSKSQFFVQKFNFDKTPTFSRVFCQKFFDNFSREIKVVNS